MDPRMAARRRKVAETRVRKGLRRLLVALILAGVGATVLLVLRSGWFSLDRIDVAGESQTDPAAMAASAGAVTGTPLIELDLDAISATLLTDPRIAAAEVGRRWPKGLEIVVEEREPVAWVDRGQGWEHTAVDGVVIATGDPGPVAPRIRATAGLDRPVEAALQFVDALPPVLAAGMVVDARAEELLASWNGMSIRLGRATDMEAKAVALEVVIASAPPAGSEITLIAPERPAVLPPTTTTTPEDGSDA